MARVTKSPLKFDRLPRAECSSRATIMGILRERLKESVPDLHTALERGWSIARDEWLPAIPASESSFNSYPHLRNIEHHLEQVVLGFESLARPNQIQFRPVELYVLLSAVLYHDVGRTSGDKDHSLASYYRIRADYGRLGIFSQELANCIADVSVGHDPPKEVDGADVESTWDKSRLNVVTIDPHGPVRQRLLWALLVLIDHMDGTYRRVLPLHVQAQEKLGVKGLFRSVIRGVYADFEGQLVRTVLLEMDPPVFRWKDAKAHADDQAKPSQRGHRCYSFAQVADKISGWRGSAALGNATATAPMLEAADQPPSDAALAEIVRWIQAAGFFPELKEELARWGIETRPSKDKCGAIWRAREKSPWVRAIDTRLAECGIVLPDWAHLSPNFGFLDWAVAFRFIYGSWAITPAGGGENRPEQVPLWPNTALIAAIMSDTLANDHVLREIQDDLAIVGIPVRAWLLEHREHLYNRAGFETHEPIFTVPYLLAAFDCMQRMCLRIFGGVQFSYEELAAEMRDPNVAKVRRAVSRIAIVTRLPPRAASSVKGREADPIWAGDSHWRWNSLPSSLEPDFKTVRALVAALEPPVKPP